VVGAQLAQVVKELRTHYAAGITACATRLADQLQGREATRLRRILSQAAPPRQELIRLLGVPNTQQVCGWTCAAEQAGMAWLLKLSNPAYMLHAQHRHSIINVVCKGALECLHSTPPPCCADTLCLTPGPPPHFRPP
jgi:hypothetical protein